MGNELTASAHLALGTFFLLLLVGTALSMPLEQIDNLFLENKLEQAEVELKKHLQAEPNNPEVLRRWGFWHIFRARTATEDEAKALRKKAREILVRARENGDRDELSESLIQAIPEDGGGGTRYSSVEGAHQAMVSGENAFAEGDYAEAAVHYQKAADLDPEIYQAPLFEGDAWLKQGKVDEAVLRYRRATELQPNLETAYRYWGNALLFSGDSDGALDRYAHAVVAQPTSRLAWARGLGRWAEERGAQLDIPKIKVMAGVSKDGKSIELDPEGISAPWLIYAATLATWRNETFAQRFPGEPYRQTVYEEAEALANVAKVTEELQAAGKLEPTEDLSLLMELKEKDLMEAFVFFSRPSESIMQDYETYRAEHRDKLVRFLAEYVVQRDSLVVP